MNTKGLQSVFWAAVLSMIGGHSIAAPAPKAAPTGKASSFPCRGFVKRADGSWWAGPNTLPFDVGNTKGMVVRDSGPITPHFAIIDGQTLYEVLEENCGAKRLQNSRPKG